MRRRLQDLHQPGPDDPVGARLRRRLHACPLAGNREWHRERAPTGARDAVAREIHRLDLELDAVWSAMGERF
jgi:hypothetical protein